MFFEKVVNKASFESHAENGVSRRSRLVLELVKEFNSNDFLRTHMRENTRGQSDFDKGFKYPEHFQVMKLDMNEFRMEFLKRLDSKSDKVVLQLHGGGYVGMLRNYYRTMAGLYSEVGEGLSVLTIDYRVAPDNPYPAALDDAFKAYEWLIDYGYSEEQIIIGGDSAGGGLALSLCHYLKANERKLPSGLVLMSPWTDLTLSGVSYEQNRELDLIFGNGNDGLMRDNPYVGNEDATSPYISPLFGDFEGFPPMLVQVGSTEMLYSDSYELEKKAKEAGVKVRFSEYEGMFHVFQAAAKLMPESMKAWAEVGRFIKCLRL